jgi:hypothetical protein
MNRRDFLKFGGAASATLLLLATPAGSMLGPKEAQAKGVRYHGTADGKIYKSADGKSWEQMVNFGPDYTVTRVVADVRGNVSARLAYAGLPIYLHLQPDGKTWRT